MRIVRTIQFLLFALFTAFAVVAPAAAETYPTLTGRVVDAADILDQPTRSAIATMLTTLEQKTTDQLVVATVGSLQGQSIEVYANRLANRWALGQKYRNNGVLLLVAPTERKVRIEVGYGLEGVLPDAVASYIIQQTILPRFRAGDMAGGVTRGVDNIVGVLTGNAADWKARAAAAQPARFTRIMHGIAAILSWLPHDLVIVIGIFLPAVVLSLLSLAWLYVLLPLLLWIAIALGLASSDRWAALARRQRAWHFLAMLDSTSTGTSSGRSSSSGWGWLSSGSGFSGGGGSFGGGGASGSW
jgi:uncharacterized protein